MTTVGAATVIQTAMDVRGMDLETALMAVQSNRANLLEAQLKGQIEDVQKKNDRIAALNQQLGTLNGMASKFDSGAKAGDTVSFSSDEMRALADAQASSGMPPSAEVKGATRYTLTDSSGNSIKLTADQFQTLLDKKAAGQTTHTIDGHTYSLSDASIGGATKSYEATSISKGTIDKQVQELKSNIDALSNSQQMDMLRLQSLSNKRNEAFDIMTNSVKKFADARSSIVGNMR